MIRVTILIAGLLLAAEFCVGQQYRGSVRVTVVDEVGNVVTGATALAQPTDRGIAGMIPQFLTGMDGTCTVRQLEYGRYIIAAGKPEDGYPERTFSFYLEKGSKREIVYLSTEHETDSVIVPLGKKAGILTGTVADAVTGRPLDANVEFRWVFDPRSFLKGSGLTNAIFRVLVPSDVAITMVVSHDGYQDWVYGSASGSTGILLKPGQELSLRIRMLPKPAKQTTPAPYR